MKIKLREWNEAQKDNEGFQVTRMRLWEGPLDSDFFKML